MVGSWTTTTGIGSTWEDGKSWDWRARQVVEYERLGKPKEIAWEKPTGGAGQTKDWSKRTQRDFLWLLHPAGCHPMG